MLDGGANGGYLRRHRRTRDYPRRNGRHSCTVTLLPSRCLSDSESPLPASTPPPAPFSPAVATLLEAVPEFVPTYRSLVEEYDADPGDAVVFAELTEFVGGRLASVEQERPVLERALAAVDAVAAGDPDAVELIGFAFLDGFSPDERRILTPWLGPSTRTLLEELDSGLR